MYRDIPEVRRRLLRELTLQDEDELFRVLGIDFRWIEPKYTGPSSGEPASGRTRNIFGVEYIHHEGAAGGYWEPEVFPLREVEDPSALEKHPWPRVEWFDFSVMEQQFRRFEGYALMTAPTVYCSPGILSVIQDLFGMEKTMVDMYANPELWRRCAEKIMDFNIAFLEKFFYAAKGRIDFFRIGEDYGTQRGLLFGPAQYRAFLEPHNRRLAALAKTNGAFYYHHSCGAVRQLIPDLIDVGVDVLDPVQVQAAGMDLVGLKGDFGGTLCFSGGIDEQGVLPNGTPQQVREAVWKTLDVMSPGGGYFLGPTHNFQEDIPTANIVAMYESAKEYFQ